MKFSAQYIYYPDGTLEIIDDRIFEDCKTFQIQRLKIVATEKILEVAPDYKQRNAALGLLSQEETDTIKSTIQTLRTAVNVAEQQIASIVWDGTEETRAAACDAVQAIVLTGI
jgi:hypothetical protein